MRLVRVQSWIRAKAVSVLNSHITLVSSLLAIGKSKGVLLAGKEAATSISVLLVPREVGIEAKEGHLRQ